MTICVGVDGCRAGWVAARHDASGLRLSVHARAVDVWAAHGDAAVLLADVPIGLPDAAPRHADAAARASLGRRGSSVFAVPVRAAVYAATYAEACAIQRAATGGAFSRQAWNIMGGVRAWDALLTADGQARAVVAESHPEVVFAALAGGPLAASKKTVAGVAARRNVLAAAHPHGAAWFAQVLASPPPGPVALDDVLDALALLAAATLGVNTRLPATPTLDTDAHGLPMQIVYHDPACSNARLMFSRECRNRAYNS